MFLFPFIGLWVRFIFVYKLNWKKMRIAYRENKDAESYKNLKAGVIGFVVIVILFALF